MRKAIKTGIPTEAYRLDSTAPRMLQLIEEGKIKRLSHQQYAVYSQEAINGAGEIVEAHDYVKIDNLGYPYPNKKEWFESRHTRVGENLYLQIPTEVLVWQTSDPVSEEIDYLIQSGKLKLNKEDESHYYNSFLFGANLSAPKTAYLVIFSVERGDDGKIKNIDYNFVAADYFEKNYREII